MVKSRLDKDLLELENQSRLCSRIHFVVNATFCWCEDLWNPDMLSPRYIDSIKNRCEETGLEPISVHGTSFGGQGHNTVTFGKGVTDFSAFVKHLNGKKYGGYLVGEQAWRSPKGDWKNDLRNADKLFSPYQEID